MYQPKNPKKKVYLSKCTGCGDIVTTRTKPFRCQMCGARAKQLAYTTFGTAMSLRQRELESKL